MRGGRHVQSPLFGSEEQSHEFFTSSTSFFSTMASLRGSPRIVYLTQSLLHGGTIELQIGVVHDCSSVMSTAAKPHGSVRVVIGVFAIRAPLLRFLKDLPHLKCVAARQRPFAFV